MGNATHAVFGKGVSEIAPEYDISQTGQDSCKPGYSKILDYTQCKEAAESMKLTMHAFSTGGADAGGESVPKTAHVNTNVPYGCSVCSDCNDGGSSLGSSGPGGEESSQKKLYFNTAEDGSANDRHSVVCVKDSSPAKWVECDLIERQKATSMRV